MYFGKLTAGNKFHTLFFVIFYCQTLCSRVHNKTCFKKQRNSLIRKSIDFVLNDMNVLINYSSVSKADRNRSSNGQIIKWGVSFRQIEKLKNNPNILTHISKQIV